jgi:SPX domain protein involved in polyphosphate accumulation
MAELLAPPPYSNSGLRFTDLAFFSTSLNRYGIDWTPQQKFAFAQEVIKALDDDNNKKTSKEEVEKLNEKSKIIIDGFQKVSQKFQQLHDGAIKEAFKKQVAQFKSEWDGYLKVLYRLPQPY